jgi:hypothetical protein
MAAKARSAAVTSEALGNFIATLLTSVGLDPVAESEREMELRLRE